MTSSKHVCEKEWFGGAGNRWVNVIIGGGFVLKSRVLQETWGLILAQAREVKNLHIARKLGLPFVAAVT